MGRDIDTTIDCSIIIPVYCNEDNLKKMFATLYNDVILKNQDKLFEVIFIDDGSRDDSLNEIIDLKQNYPNLIKIIKFTRNFGQLSAIIAGYNLAKGKCLVNISADLQDPPKLINEMLNYHVREKYEIVICARDSRDEPFFIRKTSAIFYKAIKTLSFRNMPVGGFDFVLISQNVKKAILSNREVNPFWQGQILWTGYSIKFIPYHRGKREIGKSQWTLGKKLEYLLDGVMSYSYFPLRAMSMIGIIVALIGFLYAIVIIFARIFGRVPFKGWAPIMILILVLSGLQMFMFGIMGEYIWRILEQTKNRSSYIIEKIYD